MSTLLTFTPKPHQADSNVIAEAIEALITRKVDEKLAELKREQLDEEAENTRRTLERIKAKDFASANEVATLFGCSASHIRNLVQRAIDGKTEHPIPFHDLGGVVVFPINELLEWSKHKPVASSRVKGLNSRHSDSRLQSAR